MATVAFLVDAAVFEPYALTVSRHVVAGNVTSPLVIAHLTDLHTHGFGARERRTVEILDDARPDLIVVTGDVVDTGSLEPARELFTRLHAPLGVWVVRGNWENWKPPPNERAFYASVGATLLLNEGRRVRSDVWLAGVDDPMSGNADMASALRGASTAGTLLRTRSSTSPAASERRSPLFASSAGPRSRSCPSCPSRTRRHDGRRWRHPAASAAANVSRAPETGRCRRAITSACGRSPSRSPAPERDERRPRSSPPPPRGCRR